MDHELATLDSNHNWDVVDLPLERNQLETSGCTKLNIELIVAWIIQGSIGR